MLALRVLLLAAVGRSVETQVPSPVETTDTFRLSVNVDLVVLHATVRNREGFFVSDLRREQFQVYEDNVPQAIRLFRPEDIPVTVGLVVDHSGSMRRKMAEVIEAAKTFAKASNPEDEMFVVNFNEKVSLGLPAAIRFTHRADELERAILNGPVSGLTALYAATARGLEQLKTGGRDKKVLIVISDGGDNASKLRLDELLKMADQSGALVYTVGIFDPDDPDGNPGVLRRLARGTGGEAYFPAPPSSLAEVCERIARDIRHQYTIGYISSNPVTPGAYRAIRVTATGGSRKLSVRSRAGYVTNGESR
jgi:Ca-activated chloride channel homolog